MTTRTWTGGGNNKASNPNDWSPAGTPQLGDTISMTYGTMNIKGSELAPIANSPEFTDLLNVSGNVTLNLSQDANVIPILINGGQATVHVRGDQASFALQTDQVGDSAVVDLAANSRWIGDFSGFAGSIVVNGGNRSLFITNVTASGVTEVSGGVPARVTINCDVGAGSSAIGANFGATVEVGKSVASGQVFQVNGPERLSPSVLQIDHPNQFFGQVQAGFGEINLLGLANADSYAFRNDMLTLYSGRKVIDKLSLQQIAPVEGGSTTPFAVEKTASGVSIYSDVSQAGTMLPLHV